MNRNIKLLCGALAVVATAQASANITFYESEGFRGRAFTTGRAIDDFRKAGFNDAASSVIVGGGRWEACEDSRYGGKCVLLREGNYDSLKRLGVNNRLSSVRKVSTSSRDDYYAPEPQPTADYEYRRRSNERVYEVPVRSAHAVLGPQEERCWVEREQVRDRGSPSAGGAVVGAIIGGVLGHQIGSGNGKDLATAGGVVAGAAVGANAGRSNGDRYDRDVRRCEAAPSGPPDYWDVTYNYRGVEHRVQMSEQPGRTILVNRNGEPRQ